jgi:DNA-binding MarR family transcriptional regulator
MDVGTVSQAQVAPTGAAKSAAPHVVVAEEFVRLIRTFKRHHAQIAADPQRNVEWTAQMVLRCVERAGPLRAGAVADRLNADPSTVSRQVAALVKDGLLERRADPEDGRASLLALTARAGRVLRDYDTSRDEHFERMLAAWSERDLRTFADLLARFTDDFAASSESITNPEGTNR